MNFSKLPKNKRNQLIMVALLTVIALGGLGFGLIKWQYANLRELAGKREVAEKKFARVTDTINRADQIETGFNAKNKALVEQEDAMASGDIYSWAVNSLRRFKLSYKVEIPQISQPAPPGDVNLLPKFPYKQVTFRAGGTAYFHDFGKFIADFENQSPHVRVLNLVLEPSPSVGAGEKEKLAFQMDIVTLVKPDAP
ncbi:MAG: hypothetical protein MUF81_01000 [Verrucomicrobia bacterium]|nr:hypothetical protein [Verrucomicrobiota bacterium]